MLYREKVISTLNSGFFNLCEETKDLDKKDDHPSTEHQIKEINQYLLNCFERVRAIEEKIEYILSKLQEPVPAITDTERLDFIEKNMLGINTPDFDDREDDEREDEDEDEDVDCWNVYSYDFNEKGGIDIFGKTLRQAIDAAMSGKD